MSETPSIETVRLGHLPVFSTTQWTNVLKAKGKSPEAKVALSDLCSSYYAPVQAFIRQRIKNPDRVKDLTQEFFSRLLEKNGIDSIEPGRSRFRSFLLGAVKHFLSDQLNRERAAKRGGGKEAIPIEPQTETSPGFEVATPIQPNADKAYDREWAVTLLKHSLIDLKNAFEKSGKGKQFDVLKHWLPGESSISQSVAATKLNLSEGALKVAIHRIRMKFRKPIKTKIAQTVTNPDHVQEELRYLIDVLS